MALEALANEVGRELRQRGLVLATAESCTGGWVAATVTSIPGSSEWFERGYVTYADISKQELLGVDPALLARYGAVSEAVARAMAEGVLAHSRARITLAVTGIAGPTGGSAQKPVGTVCFAWSGVGRDTVVKTHLLGGDRQAIRRQSVVLSLEGLLRFVRGAGG